MRWNGLVDLGAALALNAGVSMPAAKSPNLRWQVVGTDSPFGDGRFIGTAVGVGIHLLSGGTGLGGRIGEVIAAGNAHSMMTGEVYRRQALANTAAQPAAVQPGQIAQVPGVPGAAPVLQGVDYVVM